MDNTEGVKGRDLESLTFEELTEAVVKCGEKPYRAAQIFSHVHAHAAASYEELNNLPKSLRTSLSELYPFAAPKTEALQVSRLDGTRKYLFRFADGASVESVRMSYHHGHTVCISSQVGCRMGCLFCASTLNGLVRNLTAGEMLAQIYAVIRDGGERISNVVVMGCGEPMDNYDELVRFIRLLTDMRGQALSIRSITVSTCGVVPGIRKLAAEDLPVNLALSLHAPNDEIRKTIMPSARKWALHEILAAMREYYESNRRRLTFEYSLIKGVNDSEACADELARLLNGYNALVNLIPVNPVTERGLKEPSREQVIRFQKKLEKHGIHVTIRREMGRDIDGACGQLRQRSELNG